MKNSGRVKYFPRAPPALSVLLVVIAMFNTLQLATVQLLFAGSQPEEVGHKKSNLGAG